MLYSGCPFAKCQSLHEYDRHKADARILSCALRILLAATISIARVIFCVFLILFILVRISFARPFT